MIHLKFALFAVMASALPWAGVFAAQGKRPTLAVPHTLTPAERDGMGYSGPDSLWATAFAEQALASGDPEKLYQASRALSMSPVEDPDGSKSMELLQMAAAAGSVDAKARISFLDFLNHPEEENRQRALALLKELRASGNRLASFWIAIIQLQSPQNASETQEGLDKMRNLAAAGNPDAQFAMGSLYLEGEVVPRDPLKAVEFLSLAVSQGHPSAMMNLGICYGHGVGVPHSPEKAFELYLAAAEYGDTDAMHNIGNAYMKGNGVSQDKEKALHWMKLAVRAGKAESMTAYALVILDHPASTRANHLEALDLLQKAAGLDNPLGLFILGMVQLEGHYGLLEPDFNKAFDYIQRSANAGFSPAQLTTAQLLIRAGSEGAPVDVVEIAKWLILAEEFGLPDAGPIFKEIRPVMTEAQINAAASRASAFQPTVFDKTLSNAMVFQYDNDGLPLGPR